MRTAIQQVGFPVIGPYAHGLHAKEHGGKRCGPICHGYVDNLALATILHVDDPGQQAHRKIKRAAAIVSN